MPRLPRLAYEAPVSLIREFSRCATFRLACSGLRFAGVNFTCSAGEGWFSQETYSRGVKSAYDLGKMNSRI